MIIIKELSIKNDNYPKLLKNIKNPPQKLYVMGNINLLNSKSMAVVGSRKSTIRGEKIAKLFSKDIVNQGINTISGMALGIDTVVHQSTLEFGGKTIAILGSGFNKIFPKENKQLFYNILDSGGAIVTEYSPNTEKCPENFRQRNRIISGMSIGVLVIEAAYRSGTSITVKYAKEQGKKIFCIPHEIDSKNGIGTNKFIREGAILVNNIEEIMKEYGVSKIKKEKKVIKEEKTIEIEKEYIKIHNAIKNSPVTLEEIIKAVKEDISQINVKLVMMELKGYIKKLPGNYYIRNGDE